MARWGEHDEISVETCRCTVQYMYVPGSKKEQANEYKGVFLEDDSIFYLKTPTFSTKDMWFHALTHSDHGVDLIESQSREP